MSAEFWIIGLTLEVGGWNEKWKVWLGYDLAVLNEDLAGAVDRDNSTLYHG